MGMHVTAEVEPHDVAREMESDGSFAMDIFASLAETPERLIKEIENVGGVGCEWHEPVAAFLRRIADTIDNA